MAHECNKDQVLEYIREDIQEIRGDVKKLLGFKWQIMGGSAVIGVVLTLIINFFVMWKK